MSSILKWSSIAVIFLIALLAIVIAVVGRAGLWVLLMGPLDRTPVDFQSLQPPDRPNWYLVCPTDYCTASANRESPIYDLPVVELQQRWALLMSQQPRLRRVDSGDTDVQQDYIQETEWLRFPDNITVRFIDLGNNRSSLAIYSRSNYGEMDFGTNAGRIESWLAAL